MKEELEPQLGRVYLAGTESDLEKGKIKVGITGRDPLVRTKEGNVTTLSEDYNLRYQSEEISYKRAGAIENHMLRTFERVHTEKGRRKEFIYARPSEAAAEIENCIENGIKTPRTFHDPKEHQNKAIEKVIEQMGASDRTKLIMACGTGKTLTSLWISETAKAQRVLFIAPRLDLVAQTLTAWKDQAKTPFRTLAVCSDGSVDDKHDWEEFEAAVEMTQSFVTTDAQEIQDYIAQDPTKKLVVFITYQSLESVIEAGVHFDIAIADEAHWTAGHSSDKELRLFHKVHSPELKTDFRLFQTATPKVFDKNFLKRIEQQEDVVAFDMNCEKTYGKVAFEYSLGQAIQDGQLCDYRVHLVGLTHNKYHEIMEQTNLNDAKIARDSFAAPVIADIVLNKKQAHHLISFHSENRYARKTAKQLNALGIKAEHVHGGMSTKMRKAAYDRFERREVAVLTTCKVLGEGVNIPIVDAVFFADAKTSPQKIVQAVGREMRPYPKKELAHVYLPIYADGDLNEAITKSDYSFMATVINALAETDYRVETYVKELRKGEGRGNIPSQISELINFVNLGPALQKYIKYEVLGRTTYWTLPLEEQIVHYKYARGLSTIKPDGKPMTKKQAQWWAIQMRKKNKQGRLVAEDKKRIEESIPDWKWSYNSLPLEERIAHYNYAMGLSTTKPDGEPMTEKQAIKWAARLREENKQGLLPAQHKKLIEAAIPDWFWSVEEKLDKLWWANLEKHCKAPNTEAAKSWFRKQRSAANKGELSQEKIDALKKRGIDLRPEEERLFSLFLERREQYKADPYSKENRKWASRVLRRLKNKEKKTELDKKKMAVLKQDKDFPRKMIRGLPDINAFALKHGGKALSAYINEREHVLWGCSKGHEFSSTYRSLKERLKKGGSWCPTCEKEEYRKSLLKEAIALAKKGGRTCLSTKVDIAATQLELVCNGCGKRSTTTLTVLRKGGVRCRACAARENGNAVREAVVAVCIKTGEVKHYESMVATKKDGFTLSSVSAVCRGKKHTHKGWRFYYEKDYAAEKLKLNKKT